ncbi:MAG: hypothetical protein CO189_02210 [candidate division Zixibacteria bacterium CG_4_9_14_3_um_filter_46_8]|nr:MAG: hypothetical protein CO189_02210 [candidate division Zixibacteria bacterium CG_4_9_14_3_um_filter_46_8]
MQDSATNGSLFIGALCFRWKSHAGELQSGSFIINPYSPNANHLMAQSMQDPQDGVAEVNGCPFF